MTWNLTAWAGAKARATRSLLASRVRELALYIAVEVIDVCIIDQRVCKKELNLLEREVAEQLIEGAPAVDKIIADGKTLFSPLTTRYSNLVAFNKAESRHASVAAASVMAKSRRDEIFERICTRYRPTFGELAGGGYANAKTRSFLRAYATRHHSLPPEARRSWPHDHLRDILGEAFDPKGDLTEPDLSDEPETQLDLFSEG